MAARYPDQRSGDSGLSDLENLEKLYVYRTDMTIGGTKELNRRLPRCEIYYRSDKQPE